MKNMCDKAFDCKSIQSIQLKIKLKITFTEIEIFELINKKNLMKQTFLSFFFFFVVETTICFDLVECD